MSNDRIMAAQRVLLGVGHSPGKLDGWWGAKTADAMHRALAAGVVDLVARQPHEPVPVPKVALNERSRRNLHGVHPDLVHVIERAAETSPAPFTVIEGLRTAERQRQLVAAGASKTMNSRHLTGHAVDLAPHRPDGQIAFDWPLYHRLAPAVKQAAADLGVAIVWGGDWRTFKDGPHFELDRNKYP
jgi:peptidoglycan LD-endopeptidase CwlK